MQYRVNPRNGDRLSVLGYGCMRFTRKNGSIDQEKAEAEMTRALELGVNYFDTAWRYPGNEIAVGRFLAKGHRKEIFLATKMPQYKLKKESDADRFFQEELERLQTDYIDYYLMHMLSDFRSWERIKNLGIVEWIEKQKNTGAVRQIGFSYHGGTEDFLKILEFDRLFLSKKLHHIPFLCWCFWFLYHDISFYLFLLQAPYHNSPT